MWADLTFLTPEKKHLAGNLPVESIFTKVGAAKSSL